MTEQQIRMLFTNRRCLEAEIEIISVCAKELIIEDKTKYLHRYCLLERKIAVIDHLLNLLPDAERFVVQKHLIDGLSWSDISEMVYEDKSSKLPYDNRSLQRIQARALKRINTFLRNHFKNDLDFLMEDEA